MRRFSIPRSFAILGGPASIVAGILLVAGFALHSAGEDATFGIDPAWLSHFRLHHRAELRIIAKGVFFSPATPPTSTALSVRKG
jgi:hypothetical protein